MQAWSDADCEAMRAALTEANRAVNCGEVPVGAVLVQQGRVVASGHNRCVTDHDPSAHAEIIALRAAGVINANYRLTDATLFVTLEPCVMCVGALVQARIKRVVFAAYDSKAGALGSVEDLGDSQALNHRFEVNGGLFAEEASSLLQDFFGRRR